VKYLEGFAVWICGLMFVVLVGLAIREALKWYDFACFLLGR
jgi:hypothetical protein